MNDTANLTYPGSRRIYIPGRLHPDVQVPLREILLSDTLLPDGTAHSNDPVRVYDCSGPWGDAAYEGTAEQGLPALRAAWIRARGDVEEAETDQGRCLRAAGGTPVTQRHYARQGVITPEMEFVAIRENLGREEAFKAVYDRYPNAKSRPDEAREVLEALTMMPRPRAGGAGRLRPLQHGGPRPAGPPARAGTPERLPHARLFYAGIRQG